MKPAPCPHSRTGWCLDCVSELIKERDSWRSSSQDSARQLTDHAISAGAIQAAELRQALDRIRSL